MQLFQEGFRQIAQSRPGVVNTLRPRSSQNVPWLNRSREVAQKRCYPWEQLHRNGPKMCVEVVGCLIPPASNFIFRGLVDYPLHKVHKQPKFLPVPRAVVSVAHKQPERCGHVTPRQYATLHQSAESCPDLVLIPLNHFSIGYRHLSDISERRPACSYRNHL